MCIYKTSLVYEHSLKMSNSLRKKNSYRLIYTEFMIYNAFYKTCNDCVCNLHLYRFSMMGHFFFYSLLLSKPEAAHKALSENSLLKNIEFNEKFLGEENITEGGLI